MPGLDGSYARCFPAIADAVPCARADLTEFALEAGATGNQLDAIRLATSEAVTNAVMHAYADASRGERVVQVCASVAEDELWVLVADEGDGLRPGPARSPGLGLGLVLIAQLAEDFELASRGGGGTELRMCFKLRPGDTEPDFQPRGSFAAAVSPA